MASICLGVVPLRSTARNASALRATHCVLAYTGAASTRRARVSDFLSTAQTVALALTLANSLGCFSSDLPPEPQGIAWVRNTEPKIPPPPAGTVDGSFMELPVPLSMANAKRVIVEATVFAPWGFGLGGQTRQVEALNTLLAQPNANQILLDVYDNSATSGRLLALCGLEVTDPVSYARLARTLSESTETAVTYDGCLGFTRSAADLLAEIRQSNTCQEIREAKGGIRPPRKEPG